MTYENVNALDQAIEHVVKRTTKNYYSDWKHYDRPKYMTMKYSPNRQDKDLILIARECGTYLLNVKNDPVQKDICHYFAAIERNPKDQFYFINIDKMELIKISPEQALNCFATN